MLGVSNFNRSFIYVFKNKNWMMLLAFIVGIALQLLVVEVPFFNSIFNTHNFDGFEWGIAFGLAVVPLFFHEIFVLVKFIRKKLQKV